MSEATPPPDSGVPARSSGPGHRRSRRRGRPRCQSVVSWTSSVPSPDHPRWPRTRAALTGRCASDPRRPRPRRRPGRRSIASSTPFDTCRASGAGFRFGAPAPRAARPRRPRAGPRRRRPRRPARSLRRRSVSRSRVEARRRCRPCVRRSRSSTADGDAGVQAHDTSSGSRPSPAASAWRARLRCCLTVPGVQSRATAMSAMGMS